jgi:hypothetical protein
MFEKHTAVIPVRREPRPHSQYNSGMRRAEGFNRVALAQWK